MSARSTFSQSSLVSIFMEADDPRVSVTIRSSASCGKGRVVGSDRKRESSIVLKETGPIVPSLKGIELVTVDVQAAVNVNLD